MLSYHILCPSCFVFPGDPIRSDPSRISSESDIFHKKPIGSDTVIVGFLSVGIRPGFRRNSSDSDEFRRIPTERNPTTTLSDPIDIIWIRQDPTPHESPGIFSLSSTLLWFFHLELLHVVRLLGTQFLYK